ncbi:hypothetical protein SISNIDRAFT_448509 [Sistotremastrum niveocremeum HHB9708]|uniref:Mitochondrial outer membrane protein OM14 C-terminal domain-containing protein n=1 Tax=Sistotremastrum niveocremeum HHB9708 TaxID=1314777 RepID=A0A165A078_9AGAM|nr:hypothetical protein SISNIDRAFT_448509 [Sistotremastrum niveocremeum HHB9708]
MSYASVASHNAPPPSQQPHPDHGLLNTQRETPGLVDDTTKVNMAPRDFKSNPHTTTSEQVIIEQYPESDEHEAAPSSSKKKADRKLKAKETLGEAEKEGLHLWEVAKDRLLRPGVAGGLMGIINVGLIATAGYQFYTKPSLRSDYRLIGGLTAGSLALLGAEGYAAESYRQTAEGQEEERRARKEGAVIYRQSKEIVLRPGVLGGLVGALNLGVLGTVGYFAYTNWDHPHWDRRTVSAVTVGLVSLWAGEGFLAEQYKEKEYPKRK